jgi:hypothetical protein
MRYSGKVMIEKVTEKSGKINPRNPHGRDNVNVAQGPRTGNPGAHEGKRGAFKAAKEERAPLATVIEEAYAKRQHEYQDYEYTNGGSIMDNVNEGPRKRPKKK